MKQAEDKFTGELPNVPPVVLKRPVGRPKTGNAMTAAERQKRSRERRRAAGVAPLNVAAVDAECVEALRRHVEFKDMTQGEALTKIIRDRLLRKR